MVVQVGGIWVRTVSARTTEYATCSCLSVKPGSAPTRSASISGSASPASRPIGSCEARSYPLSQACATTRIAISRIRGASWVRNLMAAPSSCSAWPTWGA